MPVSAALDIELVARWALGAATLVATGLYLGRRRARMKQLGSEADNLLQASQGFILTIQGIINELSPGHPTRQRMEESLDLANTELTSIRERMEQHCDEL